MSRAPSPRLGITEGVRTPGLAVIQPTLTGAERQADDLARALGLTAGVVQQIGDMKAEERSVLRGAAAQSAAREAPEYEAMIESGELFAPEGADIDKFLADFVLERTPDEAPATYANERLARLVPYLKDKLLAKQEANQREAIRSTAIDMAEGLAGKTDPAEFDEALQSLVGLGMDELEARRTLGIEAYRYAALMADGAARDAAAKFLGDLEPHKQAEFDLAFERRRAEQERAQMDVAESEIAGHLIDDDFSGANALADKYREQFGNEWALGIKDDIKRRQKQYLSDAVNLANSEEFKRSFNEILAGVEGAVINGSIHTLPEDFQIKLPDGRVRDISREEFLEAARQKEWARIAEVAETPEQMLGLQVKWMSRVGDLIRVPEWEVHGRNISASVSAISDDDEEALQIATQSVVFLDRLNQLNPGLAKAHSSESSYALMRKAMFLSRDKPDVGLKQAIRAANSPISADGAVLGRELDKAVKEVAGGGIFSSAALNTGEVRNTIRRMAEDYISLTGSGVEAALKAAKEDYRTNYRKIDGVMQRVGGVKLPPNLDDVTTVAKTWFVEKHGNDLGVTADEVLVRRGEEDKTWRFYERGSLLPLSNEALTDREVHTIGAVMTDDEALKNQRRRLKEDREKRARRANLVRLVLSRRLTLDDLTPNVRDVPAVPPAPEFSDIPDDLGATATEIIKRARNFKPGRRNIFIQPVGLETP